MKVLQEDDGKKGRFFIEAEGHIAAEMTYVYAGTDRMIIDHTEVAEELKGMGAGKQMVREAVTFARKNHIKIMPICPFAKSVFDKVAEFRDVL